jgi:hypothetical protein
VRRAIDGNLRRRVAVGALAVLTAALFLPVLVVVAAWRPCRRRPCIPAVPNTDDERRRTGQGAFAENNDGGKFSQVSLYARTIVPGAG